MNLIRRKQAMHRAALELLKDYKIPESQLQAYGMIHRSDDPGGEFAVPDYIALATKRYLITLRLNDWSTKVSNPYNLTYHRYLLSDLRLIRCKKGFFGYLLVLLIDGKEVGFTIPRRFKWHNYEELAVYLCERVGKESG